MDDRQKRLLALIERALGKAAYGGPLVEEGEDVEYAIDDDATINPELSSYPTITA